MHAQRIVVSTMRAEERFQRTAERAWGGKIANRVDFYGTSADLFATDRASVLRLLSVGDFVSRLWARFGPPDSVQSEGFNYTLVDRETGMRFTAYSAGSWFRDPDRGTPSIHGRPWRASL